jgi:hypothetical protein
MKKQKKVYKKLRSKSIRDGVKFMFIFVPAGHKNSHKGNKD